MGRISQAGGHYSLTAAPHCWCLAAARMHHAAEVHEGEGEPKRTLMGILHAIEQHNIIYHLFQS